MSIMGTYYEYLSYVLEYSSTQVLSLSLAIWEKIWVALRVPVLYINIVPCSLIPEAKS